jgi:hypothetical protein
MMPETLTLTERELAAQVGVRTCALVLAKTGVTPGENPLHSYERSQSVEDMGAPILVALGVLRHDGYEAGYKPALPEAQMADAIRAHPDLPAQYDALLAAFFQFITMNPGGYPTTRAPFDPPADWAALTRALLRQGLLDRQGAQTHWTDDAAPLLEAAGKWCDGVSRADEWRAQTQHRADTLWDAMPLLVRMRLRWSIRGLPGFQAIDLIRRHYTDGAWHMRPRDEKLPKTGDHIGSHEASALYRRLLGQPDPGP